MTPETEFNRRDTRLTETLVTRLGLPEELRRLDLDPEQAARRKARRLHHLDTFTIPMLRFVGFAGLSGAIYFYLRFFDHQPEAGRVALGYGISVLVYCLTSLLLLRTVPQRFARRLAVFFLAVDVLLQTVAIYLTGGEESWLVALLLLRMADQATTGQRRAIFFTHFNVACFLALTSYLAWGEGRDIEWPREATKAVLLYSAGWWVAVSARGGDQRRRRVSAAVEGTQRMVRELETQARHLDDAKARAELANEAKSQFLANMSHELRTPLSAVVGTADLLAREDLTPRQHQFVELLQTSADSVLSLIDDILDFSKIEADKLTTQPEWTQLETEIEAVDQLLEHRAREHRVTLRYNLPTLPTVWLDPARFRQVLLNLVGNAVKFTQDGSVDVRFKVLKEERERLRLRVEVEDTGIGISPAHQQHLFEPFTQADASLTRRYGGTGLGLAIVQRLVEMMDGTIGLASQVGVGSTFWFELPLAWRKAAPPSGAIEATEPAPQLSPHVLLAEDNPVNSIVAKAMLESLGATVETAGDGHAAYAAFQRGNFDLVLMDCSMPGMDGFQATREIRRWESETGNSTRRTPIVALTAHALAEERTQCLAAGMDDHLTKPVRRQRLASLLATC